MLIREVDAVTWASAFREYVIEKNDWCYLRYWEPEKLRRPRTEDATVEVYDLFDVVSHQISFNNQISFFGEKEPLY